MFTDKVEVYGPSRSRVYKFSAARAVTELADALGVRFSADNAYSCEYGLRATLPAPKKPVTAEMYRDGKPELATKRFMVPNNNDGGYHDEIREVPRSASFTLDDAVKALAAGLGMEFRAEYVVGSTSPVLVAVKAKKV